MSIASLEREILAEARTVFQNSKLRKMDIQEWSTSEIKPIDGEVVARCPVIGCYVAIKKEHDKRS